MVEGANRNAFDEEAERRGGEYGIGMPISSGMPDHIRTTDSTDPSISVSPCAKFTARTADHMM